MHRIILMVVGVVSFVIGTIAIYIPGLPTTIFYIIAAYCLGRSNKKLHQKLVNSKHYKAMIHEPFIEGNMTKKKQLHMFLSMGVVFAIGIYFVPTFWKIVLLIIYIAHIIGLSWYWSKPK